MRKGFRVFLYIILALSFVMVLFVMPIKDLTDKQNVKTVDLIYATEFFEVKHSVNYILPIGKDYYYIGIDDDGNSYTIHAPKNWAEKNFDEYSDTTFEITALSKKITDYDITKEINSMTAEYDDLYFPLGNIMCLEVTYIKDSIMKIISGIIMSFLIIIGIPIFKNRSAFPPVAVKLYAVVFFIAIFFTLVTIV
ncbi:MAG: hypothetical protein K2J08_08030 [Ruminococcus sp.]|nr:hypothetical protein [Ruminococcus sp.]